jgi:hypothetical protein
MRKQYFLLPSLLLCFCTASFGQIGAKTPVSDWKAVSISQHQKSRWLVGLGPTFLGGTAKAGHFVANRTWIGVEGEIHSLLSSRQEIGPSVRYYVWESSLLSVFAAAGVSYGRFQQYSLFNIDGDRPDPAPYYRTKFSGALGLDYPLGRRTALEGVLKMGKPVGNHSFQPSLQLSLNVSLGK